eukprot:scaffold15289_cov194-Skeletonema_dohrnii-CCMP3373.AAC.1
MSPLRKYSDASYRIYPSLTKRSTKASVYGTRFGRICVECCQTNALPGNNSTTLQEFAPVSMHISCRLQVLLCHALLSIDQVSSVNNIDPVTSSHDQEALFSVAMQLMREVVLLERSHASSGKCTSALHIRQRQTWPSSQYAEKSSILNS